MFGRRRESQRPMTAFPSPDDALYLLEHSSDAVVRGSNDGIIEWCTSSVERITGWSRDDLVGTAFLQLVHPADAMATLAVQSALRDGQDGEFEVRLRCRDASYRWIRARVRPLIDAAGEVTGRLACWHDIHAEVDARARHHERIHRLEAALESMVDPYVCSQAVRDTTGKVVDFVVAEANSAATAHLGWPHGSMVGALVSALLPPGGFERFRAASTGVLETGIPLAADGVTATTGPGAGTALFDVSVTRVSPSTVSTTWRNVSSHIELLQARADIAAADAAASERQRLARDLHDGLLQQVLASGMLTTSLLARLPDDEALLAARILSLQEAQVRQLRSMMLAMGPGEAFVDGTAACLRSIVAEAATVLAFEPALSLHGPVDEIAGEVHEHLAYALREMLANVARHAAASSVDVSVHVFADRLTLTVADNGRGFSAESTSGRGLLNLRGRARQLGGWFSIVGGEGRSTVATWTVPTQRSAH